MKEKAGITICGALILLFMCPASLATPSTQIWNVSTDVQRTGTVHFGIDNYFTLAGTENGGYAFPTDLGLTYGLFPGLEVGIDGFYPQKYPATFNAKYALPEGDVVPALAVGGFGFGTEADVTDQNVIYALAAKTFPIGRFSAGYFCGNRKLLIDPLKGIGDNAGVILTWDKAVTDKLWVSLDYSSTKSALGAFFYGFSWVFSRSTSVLFGYGTFNSGAAAPVATTQLDINL